MKIIDLTMQVDEKTPAYPGDPRIEVRQIAKLNENGWNEKRLEINSHSGTHIDAPFHMIADGKKLEEYDLQKFIGKGVVINAVGNRKIGRDSIKGKKIKGTIVFFRTDHSKNRYGNYFENTPEITIELAQEIVKQKASIIGIDFASPDSSPFDIHKLLLKNDILIVENLVNLDKISKAAFKVIIMPLNLQQADGAPCRVIAIEGA